MAQLTVILMAALPALALMRGFGGVPWALVLGGMTVVLGAAGCVQVSGPTVLQNGVSPTPDYAGCTDTWISAEAYERVKDRAEARFVGHMPVKGHSQPDPVYEVVGLRQNH